MFQFPGLGNLFAGLMGGSVAGTGTVGLAGGLQGLFASLLGGQSQTIEGLPVVPAEGAAVDVASLQPALKDALAALKTQLAQFATEGVLPEGGATVLVTHVQVVVTTLQAVGMTMDDVQGLESLPATLQAAFEKLDLDDDEAAGAASTLAEALAVLRDHMAQMQQALVAHQMPQHLQGQVVELNVTSATFTLSDNIVATPVQQVGLFAKNQAAAPTRSLLPSIEKGEDMLADKVLPQSFSQAAKGIEPDVVTTEVKLEVSQQQVLVADMAADAVQDAVNNVQAKPQAHVPTAAGMAVTQHMEANVAQAMQADGYRAEGVKARRAEAPEPIKGVKMYQWQQTKAGFDVLQQVQPMEGLVGAENQGLDGLAGRMAENNSSQVQTVAADKATALPQFADQIARFAQAANIANQTRPVMQTLLAEGGGEVYLKLHPKELGEVRIELTIADGMVTGAIAAQRPEVVEQLARELQNLKQGLQDAGFTLGQEGIAFMLDTGSGQQNPQGEGRERNQNGDRFADAMDGVDQNTVNANTPWLRADALVDMNV
ncbi:MAG: flagellar hook-length control protein FliK [Alphaproteobacteria bacterium]